MRNPLQERPVPSLVIILIHIKTALDGSVLQRPTDHEGVPGSQHDAAWQTTTYCRTVGQLKLLLGISPSHPVRPPRPTLFLSQTAPPAAIGRMETTYPGPNLTLLLHRAGASPPSST
ncbi:hypothetical protein Sme01_38360 [Sphaerisporangium melleum]|uniref:Uncharacterized protein n=1 Tax=Sphaerisporangium melleum TaxID=321316 RepID=A0A917R1I0_9ACTN|nr:hypothetical protein GCM10007964_26130 [Sphaerisporangium melleum]GII71360.1 hypothetical protein Sme01_38360 [Sphaerisporangium melleum]